MVSGQAGGHCKRRGACPDRGDSGASAHPRRAGGSCRKGAAGRWITGTQTLLMGTLAQGCWRSCDGEPLGFADFGRLSGMRACLSPQLCAGFARRKKKMDGDSRPP